MPFSIERFEKSLEEYEKTFEASQKEEKEKSEARGFSYDLSSQDINDEDAIAIARVLKVHPHIIAINISRNFLGENGISALSSVEGVNISGAAEQQGTKSVSSQPKSIELSERVEQKGDIRADAFDLEEEGPSNQILTSEFLKKVETQHYPNGVLNLSYKKINGWGVIQLVEAIKKNPSIKGVDLSGNPVGDEGAEALSTCNLVVLKLIDSHITGSGSPFLFANPHFKGLALDNNRIGDRGLSGVDKNSTLKVLSLSDNGIKGEGISLLAKNKSIENLSLDHNSFGNEGVKRWVAGGNTTVTTLNLSGNGIDDVGTELLAKSLTSVTKLILYDNQVKSSAGRLIDIPTLTELDLSTNQLGSKEAADLASKVASNASLQVLDLSLNKIGDEGALAFKRLLETRSGSFRVSFFGNPTTVFSKKHEKGEEDTHEPSSPSEDIKSGSDKGSSPL